MTDALPLLARELTDLSDAVRAVPAPPIPHLDAPYAMRLVDPDTDAAMISEWMNRPHLAEAWEYDRPVEWWDGYLRAQLAGEYSRPLIGTPASTSARPCSTCSCASIQRSPPSTL